jgi:hypothetical protein
MRIRRRYRLLLLGLCAVALAVYFEPSHCVRGWLWGEAFFDGRPTSWWRGELERWEVKNDFVCLDRAMTRQNIYRRTPSPIEDLYNRWLPFVPKRDAVDFQASLEGPRLIWDWDNEAAIPVLRALLDDPSPKIRFFAQIGLGMNPQLSNEME